MANIINIENIGKKYLLKHQSSQRPYVALRDVLSDGARAIFGRFSPAYYSDSNSNNQEEFWALQDVSFQVEQGERVGIIGRNGAGKSTLLKILSRITEPTAGTVRIKGRVASLLEVGTGFHPELTGRENIFLNGAILGMRRGEIKKKFDEIVDFAEVEKFLDTPVKRYSSGMYVRLAFAVAAHLEPEVLVVDEVLAVGDAQFQQKCLGKMEDITTKDGRTLLFVSHNMAAVFNLCHRVIYLQNGRLVADGASREVVANYVSGMHLTAGSFDLTDPALRWRSMAESTFKWTRAQVLDAKGEPVSQIGLEEPFTIALTGMASRPVQNLEVCFGLKCDQGIVLFNSCQSDSGLPGEYREGEVTFTISFDPNLFAPGEYRLDLFATAPTALDYIRTALQFTVLSCGECTNRVLRHNFDGVILYPCTWTHVQ